VHHKKGRPSTATSHESRPGNPSFCIFGLPHRGSPRTVVGQITRKYRAWQALGILSQYQHKMLHNDAAHQRPGEKPQASQITPRAQGLANLKITTLQRPRSRHGDTKTAGLTDGNRDTLHIIHIRDAHSPPQHVTLTTYATQQAHQHSHGLAGIVWQTFKPPPRLARYHPFGEGYEQALSVLGPRQGTGQGQLPEHATEDLQQNPANNQHKAKLAEPGHKTWAYQASNTDSDKLPMHAAPSASRHHRHDSDYMQNSLIGKNRHTELAPRRPDTIPSGKDTGTPAQSSGLFIGVSTDCKFQQARSCNCRPFTLHERARCTQHPKYRHSDKKQTSRADPCVRLIWAHYIIRTLKLHKEAMTVGWN